MRRSPFVILLWALALVLAACGGGDQEPGAGEAASPAGEETADAGDQAAPAETIKIGSVHPLTGALALDGTQMDEAVKMAVEDINEGGGIQALGGAQLEVVSADTQGQPEVGQQEAERLIQEGAVALIGAFQSAVTINLATVAQREQVPLVIDVAVADEITTPENDFVFRLQPNATAMGVFGARYIRDVSEAQGEPIQSVAYMHEESAFGASVFAAFKAEAEKLGIEIVEQIQYNAFEVTDVTTEMQQVASASPDALVVTGYYNDGLLIANTANEVQPEIRAIFGVAQGAYDLPQFPQDAPDASAFVFDSNYHFDATKERVNDILTRFEERTGDAMRTGAVFSYQAVEVIAQALEEAGSSDPVDLQQAIQNISVEDPLLTFPGPIEFDDEGENVNAQPVLMQVLDGDIQQVYPEPFAQADLVYPATAWNAPQ